MIRLDKETQTLAFDPGDTFRDLKDWIGSEYKKNIWQCLDVTVTTEQTTPAIYWTASTIYWAQVNPRLTDGFAQNGIDCENSRITGIDAKTYGASKMEILVHVEDSDGADEPPLLRQLRATQLARNITCAEKLETKKILINLKAIGRPIDSIQPILDPNGGRNITADNIADLCLDICNLIECQFDDGAETLFKCDEYIQWSIHDFLFGCQTDVHEFRKQAAKFVQTVTEADTYEIAPNESDPTDATFVCRTESNGFRLRQSKGCILAKTMPEDMLDDIMNGDCQEYVILTIED